MSRPTAGRRAVRRRYAILGVLGEIGPATATAIADRLARNGGAIYADLVWMEQGGLITAEWEQRGDGRPRRRLYRPSTPSAAIERAETAERELARQRNVNRDLAKQCMRAMERATNAERELAELRERFGEPEIEWGHQVHGDDGWIGEAVPQGSEPAARAVVDHMNAKAIRPEDRCRAKLVVREVWRAETEWRVVDDGAQ